MAAKPPGAMPASLSQTAARAPAEPSRAGKIAVGLGLGLGTWLIVTGAYRTLLGRAVLPDGHLLTWFQPRLAGGGHWGVAASGAVLWLCGIAWMIVANLYLFQNTLPAWRAMVILAVISSGIMGVTSLVLAAQMLLLWLPDTRLGLRVLRA